MRTASVFPLAREVAFRLTHLSGFADSQKHFRHGCVTATVGASIASDFDVDPDHVAAGMVGHDSTKGMPGSLQYATLSLNSFFTGSVARLDNAYAIAQPQVFHPQTAVIGYASSTNYMPQEVLDAMAIHGTGSPDATPLAKVMAVADGMDPEKRGIESARIARENLNKEGLDLSYLRKWNTKIVKSLKKPKMIPVQRAFTRNCLVEDMLPQLASVEWDGIQKTRTILESLEIIPEGDVLQSSIRDISLQLLSAIEKNEQLDLGLLEKRNELIVLLKLQKNSSFEESLLNSERAFLDRQSKKLEVLGVTHANPGRVASQISRAGSAVRDVSSVLICSSLEDIC